MWGNNSSHHGTLECEYMYVEGWGDNAFYFSGAGPNGGDFHVDRCYVANTRISAFRFGTDGCTLTNSVCENMLHRGVWVWHDVEVEIENCEILVDGGRTADGSTGNGTHAFDLGDSQNNGGYVTLKDVSYDSNGTRVRSRGGGSIRSAENTDHDPNPYVPDGVPQSADVAASGDTDGGDGGDDEDEPAEDPAEYRDHVLLVDATGQGSDWTATEYAIEVEGELEPSEYENASIDPGLGFSDGDTRVEHTVANWKDAFAFDGELVDLTVDGPATIYLDGEEIDPDADDGGDDESDLEHLLTVAGSDDEPTRYEFAVSGAVETSNVDGAEIDDETEIEDGQVHSVVGDWTEAFRFDGDLEELTVDGPATVSLDGEEVDPDEYGEALPHVLEIEGSGEVASFELTVDGTIEYDGDEESDDVSIVSGTTVESSLTDATLRFCFSGALTDVTFTDGVATVSLDGEEIDPEEYGDQTLLPHALVIDGTEAEESSTYAFEVDGRVVKSEYMSASVDDEDVVDGRTVEGAVANWLDAYWFDGDVQDFQLAGDARVHLEYNARDQ